MYFASTKYGYYVDIFDDGAVLVSFTDYVQKVNSFRKNYNKEQMTRKLNSKGYDIIIGKLMEKFLV